MTVNVVQDRDIAIYQDRCRGMTKLALSDKYGLNRHKIAEIIERVKRDMPPVDRVEVFDQSVEILDQGLATFVPLMLDGDKGAARVVNNYLRTRNEMLGLDSPAKLELYQAQHEPEAPQRIDVKAELAALVARLRAGDDPHA
jgi:hypothetical protein